VGRPVDQARRDQLLERAVDHVCAVGLSGLSLRALADALDVDASRLSHHFGGKQQLLGLVLNRVRDRLRTLGNLNPEQDLDASLQRVWAWAADPTRRPLYVLFFEVYALALRHPEDYQPFLNTVISDWLDPLQAAFQHHGSNPDAARARASLAIAVVRGLLLDLLTTHDHDRATAALQLASDLLLGEDA
jgi:AcrR family transcriptional regulator